MINRLPELIARKKSEWNRPDLLQKDIATESGIDAGTLSRYINDQTKSYQKDVLEKLCQYFRVPISEILHVEVDDK